MTDLDLVFAALADPTRRAILSRLLDHDLSVGEIAEPFDMSLAAISKHLQILTRAGLVTSERRGREKWCALNPDGIAAAGQWMGNFGSWTTDDLDRIEAALGPLLDD
ncbi:ArsR/SmtB family transcription factor [Pontivivens insulae]|nr:metalloregulator ArsR/SmtB family transcription factor [Pontivivens insulae]